MRAQFGFGMTTVAAIVAALAMAACDQRSDGTAARRSDTTTAAAPAADASQKIAAATDKVATAVDDGTLTAKVKAALLAEPGLKLLQIGVETRNGAVTLSGSVDSAAARGRAVDVTNSVAGVATVVDQLTVKAQG